MGCWGMGDGGGRDEGVEKEEIWKVKKRIIRRKGLGIWDIEKGEGGGRYARSFRGG